MTKLNFKQLTELKLLLSVDGIGPGKIRQLLSKFKSISNILNADYQLLLEVPGIYKNLAQRIINIANDEVFIRNKTEKELEVLKKLNGKIVSVWDKEYPKILKKIYDPPLLFYMIGNFSERDDFSVSVVGTRQPTNYGKLQTERIVSDLSDQRITIISGLARGIDSIAHRTSLNKNNRTIAIIGSGLNVIYPPENKKLFDAIKDNGAVISEFELGTQPDAQNFPRRNRIISGLSLGTIVIETGVKGGAMQTARFALDQNREVFAVPGNVGVKHSEGTNTLIKKGEAKLIVDVEDILNELDLKLKPILGKNIPKHQTELTLFEEKIISKLNSEPIQIDKIAKLVSLSTSDCLVHLLSLEFKGLVKQLPGKMFALL